MLLTGNLLQDFSHVPMREDRATVSLDLVQILLANRIREIEGKDPLVSIPKFSGELGLDIGDDPFADARYFMDEESNRFHSVGPDGEKNAPLRYSPTNGTKSTGDIWLPLGD